MISSLLCERYFPAATCVQNRDYRDCVDIQYRDYRDYVYIVTQFPGPILPPPAPPTASPPT